MSGKAAYGSAGRDLVHRRNCFVVVLICEQKCV